MCLIVDSNVACAVFIKPAAEYQKLCQAVEAGKAKIIYGGELTREYRKVNSFWRRLILFDRQGIAKQVDNATVDLETQRVANLGICCSDDQHIIALARVGRVRLICSKDGNLRIDVRNPLLLNKPRANIYTELNHDGLLNKHCS